MNFRFEVSPAAAATIASQYLKDLILAGHLSPDKAYLACDPNKLVRARKKVMAEAKQKDLVRFGNKRIEAISYDGRRNRNTRAMVPDSATGKDKQRKVTAEHEAVVEEPSGRYLGHFKPDPPTHPEKPALKVAQGLLKILEENNATQSLQVLGGDSTNMNTGWRGGTHALLEELLGRRLYWAICNLHCNELPLRHLIVALDGPTSSKEGFTGPVCSLLSKVGEMPFNPSFKALPGGEDLVVLSEEVVKKMSTDQKMCYQLVVAVKEGRLPPALQNMKCGTLNHARFRNNLIVQLILIIAHFDHCPGGSLLQSALCSCGQGCTVSEESPSKSLRPWSDSA